MRCAGVFLLLEQVEGWRKNRGCLVCSVVRACLGPEIVTSKVFAVVYRKPGTLCRYFRSCPLEFCIFLWLWRGSRQRRGRTKQAHVLATLYLPALEWWGACPKEGKNPRKGKTSMENDTEVWVDECFMDGQWDLTPEAVELCPFLSFLALLRRQKDFLLSKQFTMYPGLWKGCGFMGQAQSDRGVA